MGRIKIEDLPPAKDLTPEELCQLEGAGRPSVSPTIETLEGREMYAANLGSALTPGLQSLAHAAKGSALVQQTTLVNEIQVLGMGNTAAPLARGAGHVAVPRPLVTGFVNPLLAPTQDAARQAFAAKYNAWWKQFGRDGGTWSGIQTLRVARPENGEDSVSEGTGYGMLLTVHWQDKQAKDRFDRLWAYAQKNFNSHGLMAWHIGQDGMPIDKNAATDADEDMAMALVKAFKRWGDPKYKEDATKLINNIMKYEVEPGTNLLKPGDYDMQGKHYTNPSYFAPAYYRVFKEFTGDARWDAVREKAYEMLGKALAKAGNTGLVPNWVDADGTAVDKYGNQTPNANIYGYDAMRTPWRFALDAVWYGDQRAINYLKQVNEFFKKGGIKNVWDNYTTDGQRVPENYNGHNAPAVSMAATAAIVDSDSAYRQAFWNEMISVPVEDRYYNESLRTLSMLFTGGLMDKPVF